MKRIVPILVLLPLLAALQNSPVFGNPSLFSWFFYMLVCGLGATLLFVILILSPNQPLKVPNYIICLLLFALYIFFHGILTGTTNFTHYYWIASALAVLAFYFLFRRSPKYITNATYTGIMIIAVLESIIVLLQCLQILPVKNDSFLCTGTWVNPNVTAMFLALSLFAVLQVLSTIGNPLLKNGLLLIVLSSILLLYCRTAHLAALLFVLNHYKEQIKQIWRTKKIFSLNGIVYLALIVLSLFIFLSPFLNKQKSMEARINIWQNSIHLILKEPLTGYGVGRFEREYNLHTVTKKLSENSHINMAYNDFLEITIEGGVPVLLIWCFFLFLFTRFCLRNQFSLMPIIAMVIIQLTNFGFQAIPVLALFLIYVVAGNANIDLSRSIRNESDGDVKAKQTNFKVIYLIFAIATSVFLYKVITITGAFYEQKKIHSNLQKPDVLFSFSKLETILSFSNGYHENFGDAYMAKRLFGKAIVQYKEALKSCSRPNVFAKCGFCFRILKQYDSSEYYYRQVQYIEPQKLRPRMALLQLYQQKRDTIKAEAKAKEILAMPMQIVSKRGVEIKDYAKKILDKIDSVKNSKQKLK